MYSSVFGLFNSAHCWDPTKLLHVAVTHSSFLLSSILWYGYIIFLSFTFWWTSSCFKFGDIMITAAKSMTFQAFMWTHILFLLGLETEQMCQTVSICLTWILLWNWFSKCLYILTSMYKTLTYPTSLLTCNNVNSFWWFFFPKF